MLCAGDLNVAQLTRRIINWFSEVVQEHREEPVPRGNQECVSKCAINYDSTLVPKAFNGEDYTDYRNCLRSCAKPFGEHAPKIPTTKR